MKMLSLKGSIVLLCLLLWSGPCLHARQAVIPGTAAIASAHPLATRAGYEVLGQGGNAFDAAVAISAALAVVEPYASGLGGGGFWLLHRAADGFEVLLDGRETAPRDASMRMYLDASGAPVPKGSLEGPRAAAIPGMPAALARLSEKYGALPLRVALAPAIHYARDGFPVDQRYLDMVRLQLGLLQRSREASHTFLDKGGAPVPGFILRQPELAATLEAIARYGRSGFYGGAVARELVSASTAAGGIWRMADLSDYRAVERKPLTFTFLRSINITSAPLPSSGGITLAEALHVLEHTAFSNAGPTSWMHLVVEALRRSFQDRARYLGDPDFIDVPVAKLMSEAYSIERAQSIDPRHATPSAALGPMVEAEGGNSTTHFSIVDKAGNRVAATLSINTPFGSGFVAGRTGVILNNEMDDFSISPGTPNVYGLVGNYANAIQPGKRPLSSMTPTFVEDNRGLLVLGTPGGPRIISMVLLGILDYTFEPNPDVSGIVSAPRFHHQYLPDRIEVEPEGFEPQQLTELEAMGHKVETGKRKWGNMQAVFVDKRTHRAVAASDPRGIGGMGTQ